MAEQNKQPSQIRAINTRNSIMNVAFDSFLTRGYKKTNTILIAKEAKVSVGIVYSYFKDKDELLELWLNSLLERCDDYFYNQFKLKEYDVELSMIIGNIIERICDSFFVSPIIDETDPFVLQKLDAFYEKIEKIFVKACFDADVFIRHQIETSHVIFSIVKAYHNDLKSPDKRLNKSILKSQYVLAIMSLLK